MDSTAMSILVFTKILPGQTFGHRKQPIKAYSNKRRAGGVHAGAIIRTMNLYSGLSDRRRARLRVLSERPLNELIVRIMEPTCAARPPSVCMGLNLESVKNMHI